MVKRVSYLLIAESSKRLNDLGFEYLDSYVDKYNRDVGTVYIIKIFGESSKDFPDTLTKELEKLNSFSKKSEEQLFLIENLKLLMSHIKNKDIHAKLPETVITRSENKGIRLQQEKAIFINFEIEEEEAD